MELSNTAKLRVGFPVALGRSAYYEAMYGAERRSDFLAAAAGKRCAAVSGRALIDTRNAKVTGSSSVAQLE